MLLEPIGLWLYVVEAAGQERSQANSLALCDVSKQTLGIRSGRTECRPEQKKSTNVTSVEALRWGWPAVPGEGGSAIWYLCCATAVHARRPVSDELFQVQVKPGLGSLLSNKTAVSCWGFQFGLFLTGPFGNGNQEPMWYHICPKLSFLLHC